jgi:serine/threonine protein kinase
MMRDLSPGSLVAGRFTVRHELGRGPRSRVYLAHDQASGSEVALKLFSERPRRLHRQVAEAAELARHRLLVPREILEGDPLLVVLDYIPGPDLAHRIAEAGPLDPMDVAEIGRQAARGLAAAHRRGILHGNLTPRNLLLAPPGAVWLTDLGTEPAGPAFLAPEARSGTSADPRSDLCSLGLVLYVALTGRHPDVPVKLPPDGHRPSLVRPDVPEWLDRAIARATALLPADRFSRAAEMVAALAGESVGRRTA